MGTIHLTRIPAEESFQILDLFIDGNSVAGYGDLAALRLPSDLDWQQGVVINGKAPIWLYAWALDRCRSAAWLAVMDPRQGGAIVVRGAEGGPAIASRITFERIAPHLPRRDPPTLPSQPPLPATNKVVAFVGPPHSGKSVLIHALDESLRLALPAESFQRDVFLLRACPDGEGKWFGEIPAHRASILRFKHHWDEDFVDAITAQIRTAAESKRLLLVDCGGRIDRRMQRILGCCNAAVIVSSSAEAAAEWRGALLASGVELLAEIESVLAHAREVSSRQPLRLRLGPLERGRPVEGLPEELVRAVVAW